MRLRARDFFAPVAPFFFAPAAVAERCAGAFFAAGVALLMGAGADAGLTGAFFAGASCAPAGEPPLR